MGTNDSPYRLGCSGDEMGWQVRCLAWCVGGLQAAQEQDPIFSLLQSGGLDPSSHRSTLVECTDEEGLWKFTILTTMNDNERRNQITELRWKW